MEKVYTVRQAGELLGIKTRTVRQWIRDKKLIAKKYVNSNRWFIEESEIKRVRGVAEDGDEN